MSWIKSETETSKRIVEVYCVCEPEIAATRFTSRIRHQGHLDSTKQKENVAASFRSLATLGPLCIGELLRVNTSDEINLSDIVSQVKTLLSKDHKS